MLLTIAIRGATLLYNSVHYLTAEEIMKIERSAPPRKEFFAEIKRKITDDRCLTCIEVAYNIAKEAHRGQMRDDGERYFEHVKAVAWILLTETEIMDQLRLTILLSAALLHDLMEDTYIAQRKHLKFIFDQFSQDIADIAWELTKPRSTVKSMGWARLMASKRIATKLVKAADRLHNVRTLRRCRTEKIRRKMKETEETILPWLRQIDGTPDDSSKRALIDLSNKIAAELADMRLRH
jgi:GTP pyrophosphokinase